MPRRRQQQAKDMGALREQVQARTAAIQSQSKEAIDAEAHSRQEALGLLHTQVTSAAEAQREVVGTLREQVIGLGGGNASSCLGS